MTQLESTIDFRQKCLHVLKKMCMIATSAAVYQPREESKDSKIGDNNLQKIRQCFINGHKAELLVPYVY